METSSPDSACLARRASTFSSTYTSTTSASSPEFTTDAAVTPESDEDASTAVLPKVEEPEEICLGSLEEVKPALDDDALVPTPKKRGRPRKHPLTEQKKASHIRSKTGCHTCRKRKKKCDETKPSCRNCEKNNVVCDGYEPRQPWRSGKQKALSVRTKVPTELPVLVSGVDGTVDQLFFQHFTCQVAKVLSLTDHHNPFLEIIVPMAMSHTGLMHSLLYLSGSCLLANNEGARRDEWEQRSEHHSSKAMRLLQQDIVAVNSAGEGKTVTVGDPSIAQTLLLCLQTVCAGDVSGSYRYHLQAMKEMLSRGNQSLPNEQLREFILEFLIYHDYSSSITRLDNPLDQSSIDLMADFKLPTFMIQPQAGTLLGVLDGLFGYISRIRLLRDRIRRRRQHGLGEWWKEQSIINDAFAIDTALREWQCVHPEGSPRHAASLLYRHCTWIYLQRTIQESKPSDVFQRAVDEGLLYLRLLPLGSGSGSGSGSMPASAVTPESTTPPPPYNVDSPASTYGGGGGGSGATVVGGGDDGSMQSILLMPLFLLGCAAFEPSQRSEIAAAFDRLWAWSSLGNIKYARTIVDQVWQMMDQGMEEDTWDWETIIAKKGWDFLVT